VLPLSFIFLRTETRALSKSRLCSFILSLRDRVTIDLSRLVSLNQVLLRFDASIAFFRSVRIRLLLSVLARAVVSNEWEHHEIRSEHYLITYGKTLIRRADFLNGRIGFNPTR